MESQTIVPPSCVPVPERLEPTHLRKEHLRCAIVTRELSEWEGDRSASQTIGFVWFAWCPF